MVSLVPGEMEFVVMLRASFISSIFLIGLKITHLTEFSVSHFCSISIAKAITTFKIDP
jgi:hypothetical protein